MIGCGGSRSKIINDFGEKINPELSIEGSYENISYNSTVLYPLFFKKPPKHRYNVRQVVTIKKAVGENRYELSLHEEGELIASAVVRMNNYEGIYKANSHFSGFVYVLVNNMGWRALWIAPTPEGNLLALVYTHGVFCVGPIPLMGGDGYNMTDVFKRVPD
jgi:hypothetical protein